MNLVMAHVGIQQTYLEAIVLRLDGLEEHLTQLGKSSRGPNT